MRWAEDFLAKYAVDGTSRLQERATYHGNNIKRLMPFPRDMPPVRDLLATLKAGDHPAIYTRGFDGSTVIGAT